MALNRALFQKQLQLGLNTIFGMEYDNYPEQWREVFSVENSNKAFEEDVLLFLMIVVLKVLLQDTSMKLLHSLLLLQKKQRKIIFMDHLAQNTLKLLQDQCNTLKKSKV
jgi:hypothetical protein